MQSTQMLMHRRIIVALMPLAETAGTVFCDFCLTWQASWICLSSAVFSEGVCDATPLMACHTAFRSCRAAFREQLSSVQALLPRGCCSLRASSGFGRRFTCCANRFWKLHPSSPSAAHAYNFRLTASTHPTESTKPYVMSFSKE